MTTWLRLLLLCSSIILPRATPFTALSGLVARLGPQSDGCRFETQISSSTSSRGDDKVDEVVWVPPSQQLLQSKSTIFKINNPEDFLSFISEDDRLTVIKVYASWCQTCRKIDMRYRKLASKFGDKYNNNTNNNNINSSTTTEQATTSSPIKERGKVRFAELQYDNPANEDLCNNVLEATSFPYFLMYRLQQGQIRGFHCTPAKFQMLVDTVEELLADEEKDEEQQQQQEEEDCVVDDSFQQQVIDLGLVDRR
jgi:thiol-disulfide isomerase/thioredoxin